MLSALCQQLETETRDGETCTSICSPGFHATVPSSRGLVPQCLNTWVFFTTFGALNKGVALQLLSDHGATEEPFSADFNQA